MKKVHCLIFIFTFIHINIAKSLNSHFDLYQNKLNEDVYKSSLSEQQEDGEESDSEKVTSLRMLNSNSPFNFGSNKYMQTMNLLYNRFAMNNFMNNGYLRPNPFNNRRMHKNDEEGQINKNNDDNEKKQNSNNESNDEGNLDDRRQVAPLDKRNRNHPSQRRRFQGILNNENFNPMQTTARSTLSSSSTLPTLNLTLHVNKKDGKNFKGMNVNVNLLNNKRYFNNNQPSSTLDNEEYQEEEEEALKLLTNLLRKKIRLSDDQQTLFVPRNSRPNSVMDSVPLYNEEFNQILIPMAAAAFFTQDVEDISSNVYDSRNSGYDRSSSSYGYGYDKEERYGYKNNYSPETTRLPFSRLNINTTTPIITSSRVNEVTRIPETTQPPIPDGVLTVISNNNNNVNINEDRYTIDELLDLVNKYNNKLTKNDLMSYDYNRKQKLLLMRDEPPKELPLRMLKSQLTHGPDYSTQIEKEQEVILKTNTSSTGLSKNGEIFKEIDNDLSYAYYPFHNGGLIIINNIGGNLNKKIKKILGNSINIRNQNSALFLPIEYLTDEEIDSLLQNAIIVNNDNNNNNIS